MDKTLLLQRSFHVARRLAATTIDGVLVSSLTGGTIVAAWMINMRASHQPMPEWESLGFSALLLQILAAFFFTVPSIWCLYDGVICWAAKGQTIGKKIFGLRVMTIKHSPALFLQSVLRGGIKMVLMVSLLFVHTPVVAIILVAITLAIPVFSKHQQFLHDMIPMVTVAPRSEYQPNHPDQPMRKGGQKTRHRRKG